MNVILEGVVGSKAYGLDTPESDEDRLGVFLIPGRDLLGLDQPKETVVRSAPHPDSTHHDLGKIIRLIMSANPTATEILWLPDELYTVRTPLGDQLISLRTRLLSNRCRKAYGGYAKGQMERLIRRGGTFSSDTSNRTAKHGRHLRRLLFQLESALTTGKIQVRLTDEQRKKCFTAGAFAVERPTVLQDWFNEELERLDAVGSVLPDEPDWNAANDFLIRVRRLDICAVAH